MRKTKVINAGFTLMELMIVCIIIAITCGIASPAYFNFYAHKRVVRAISHIVELKKAMNEMATSCRGYPIRSNVTDAVEFARIIDRGDCIGSPADTTNPPVWPKVSEDACESSMGLMLGVETGTSNALCKPVVDYSDHKGFAGRQGPSFNFPFVTAPEEVAGCTAPILPGGGSPGWNYRLLTNPGDALSTPVGVICGVTAGYKTPVKIVINTGGIHSGTAIQDGSARYGILGETLPAGGCSCGPYCEEINTGHKGCCAPCGTSKGIGYRF